MAEVWICEAEVWILYVPESGLGESGPGTENPVLALKNPDLGLKNPVLRSGFWIQNPDLRTGFSSPRSGRGRNRVFEQNANLVPGLDFPVLGLRTEFQD